MVIIMIIISYIKLNQYLSKVNITTNNVKIFNVTLILELN